MTILKRALRAIDDLFAKYPPQGRGRPEAGWTFWATAARGWAPKVQHVLLEAGWPNADMSDDDAVVPFVVAKMIFWTNGECVEANTIARFLRQPAVRALIKGKISPDKFR